MVSALRTNSFLRELDLSRNDLHDSHLAVLSSGLGNSQSTVETVRLRNCNLSELSCAALGPVLLSKSFHLRHLDLSFNSLQDEGVKQLCVFLEDPRCRLEQLRSEHCWALVSLPQYFHAVSFCKSRFLVQLTQQSQELMALIRQRSSFRSVTG